MSPDPIDDLLDRLDPDGPEPDTLGPEEAAFLADYRFAAAATAGVRRAVRAAAAGAGPDWHPDGGTDWPAVPNYQFLGVLGEGGFGTVYLARQAALGRLVAVKVLRTDKGEPGPEVRARFDREREALAALNHPNIVPVIDAGTAGGLPYLIVGYEAGGDLARYLPRADDPATHWPPADAVRVVEALARAVAAAHEVGIVHRDLKPANVLVGLPPGRHPPPAGPGLPPRAVPKVADFGLVKLLAGADDTTLSHGGPTPSYALLGTPRYMAPEQAAGRGAAAGPAADVWALGVILYELLTARPPFDGDSLGDILDAVIAAAPPPPPRTLRPDIPPAIEAACLGALRKDPAARWPSAAALADALAAAAAGESVRLPGKRRGRTWAVAAALLGAVGLGTAAVALMPPRGNVGCGGAPVVPVAPAPTPVRPTVAGPADALRLVLADLDALKDGPGAAARLYLDAPHLRPAAGLSEADRAAYRAALDALAAHLAAGRAAPLLRPLDRDGSLFAADFPDGVGRPDGFLAGYPYGLRFEADATRHEDALVRARTGLVATVRADWFVRTAVKRLAAGETVFGATGAAPAPVARWADAWTAGGVSSAAAAAELGLPDAARIALAVRAEERFRAPLGLGPLADGGSVPRAAWESRAFGTSAFQELARELGVGTPVVLDDP